jgi:protein-disulfide isomerase
LLTRIAQTSWAPLLLTVITGIGAITSAVLLVYAQLVIQATCRWCVASGIAMAVLFALSVYIYRRRKSLAVIPASTVWWLSAATVFALGGEMWLMQRQAIAAPISPAKLAVVSISELLATGNTRGPDDAPVKIIMFSDLWCSVCRALHGPLMNFQAAHPFRVQVIFRHRPLTWVRGHETSATAAALSEIAAEHRSFWRFVDEVYRQSEPLDRAGYLRLFQKLGLPAAAAEDVLTRNGTPSGQVDRDISLADRLGLRVTPVFIVLIGEDPPVAVNHRGLAKILNSEAVQAMISH